MRENKPIIITKAKQDGQGKPKAANVQDVELKMVDRRMGEAIMNARTKKGLSRKDLAQSMNKNQSIIDSWERSEAVYEEKMAKEFEKALGIKLERRE
ncbi:hypothetical protein HK407_01g00810 [Ordospora pajunii]|jgi:putative transcription factor|uniref:uncharacterized protein n=1 Tax=Ordospora pajunii TaxID=3039483 RepID=UPI0029528C1A|nr:uncharacterized protein HK407_01g00810 [Ordospora pajunii]KAH9412188.1 hypothetical protein HK407_01g00810 [Ordospora pajunii]